MILRETHGLTMQLGDTVYRVSGCRSPFDAELNIRLRAMRDGNWAPRELREKWWQFWRPVEHSDVEKAILEEQDA